MKPTTIGQALQIERQNKRVTLERLAEITSIRLDYLQALENNDFGQLPTAAYVKGFIRAYAQHLSIDAKPFIALLRRDYKETNKGNLIPREFIKSYRTRKIIWRPITWLSIGLVLFIGVIICYLGIQWFRATRPPSLVITSPVSRSIVSEEVMVEGYSDSDAVITVNDQPVALQPNGSFQTTIRFPVDGVGIISVIATDRRGKSTEEMLTVTVQR